MGLTLKAGGDIDLEVVLGQIGSDLERRMMRYLREDRRALGRHIVPDHGAAVPAAVTRPLIVDMGHPSPGLLWKVRMIQVWGDSPLSAPLASSQLVDASSGVVANAAATATMPAVAGKTNVLSSVEVTGLGATAGTTVTGTITGVQGGTQEFFVTVPAGAATPITPVNLTFPNGLVATGPNVPIVVSVPAFGAGNTNAEVNIQGQLQTGGPVQAAVFVGTPMVPQDLVGLPDIASCVAPNVSVPTPGPISVNDVIASGNEHVYVLYNGVGLNSYQMMWASADVLEAPDRPDTLTWL